MTNNRLYELSSSIPVFLRIETYSSIDDVDSSQSLQHVVDLSLVICPGFIHFLLSQMTLNAKSLCLKPVFLSRSVFHGAEEGSSPSSLHVLTIAPDNKFLVLPVGSWVYDARVRP
jgi:hypothetical protein